MSTIPAYDQHILDLHFHLVRFEAFMAMNLGREAETCLSQAEDCLFAAKRTGAPATVLTPWRRSIGNAFARYTRLKEAA